MSKSRNQLKTGAAQTMRCAIYTRESTVTDYCSPGCFDVAAADAIKLDWEQNHRFRLPYGGFAERLGP